MKQRLQVVTPRRGGETDPHTLRWPDESHSGRQPGVNMNKKNTAPDNNNVNPK
jgi:hypothetical protein